MSKKIRIEMVICLVLIVLGIIAYLTIGLSEDTASRFLLRQERELGAMDYQSLPRIYSIALVVLCSLNIGLTLYKNRQEKLAGLESDVARADAATEEEAGQAPPALVRARTLGTAALLAVYALVMPHVPFYASTALFLFLLFLLYGKTNLKVVLPLTLAGTFLFWFTFIKVASLPIGAM
jgi:hypothetical protein